MDLFDFGWDFFCLTILFLIDLVDRFGFVDRLGDHQFRDRFGFKSWLFRVVCDLIAISRIRIVGLYVLV